jgi:hypothetical protein
MIVVFDGLTMKVIMGNNWEDPMYFTLASVGFGSSVFYITVVIFGTLFVQKLFLAVMASCYAEEHRIILDINAARLKKMGSKARMELSFMQKIMTREFSFSIFESFFRSPTSIFRE